MFEGIGNTLKSKLGPLPVWVWAGGFTVVLALYLMRKKASNADQTNAAADQTNSNLGSAAELANMFEVAGLMPYQGGDIYINTTGQQTPPANPPSGGTNPPPPTGIGAHPIPSPIGKFGNPYKPATIYHVKSGDNLTKIAKQYGISEAELWKFNTDPKVRTASAIKTLKSRGQNLIYANEAIYIPPKNYK